MIKRLLTWPLRQYYKQNPDAWRVADWKANGMKGAAPHVLKWKLVKEHAARHKLKVLIETGTFQGDMVAKAAPNFDLVRSVELDDALHAAAVKRFQDQKHVTILHGDSGEQLPVAIADLKQACLFWLDGHYSEGVTAKGELVTPIRNELKHVADHAAAHGVRHVILIDDARLFNGKDDYPKMEELESIVTELFPKHRMQVRNDVVCID